MPLDINQQVVSIGSPILFEMSRASTKFDIHNDSPYSLLVSFGKNSLVDDLYMSPHGVALQIEPHELTSKFGLGNVWNGDIYVTPAIPLGGTIPSNAPAYQVTIIGYTKGYKTIGGYSLNRLQNVGNNIGVSSTNSIINDGNSPGTTIIESTPSNDTVSYVLLDNQGNLTLGKSAITGVITVGHVVLKGGGSFRKTAVVSGTGPGTFNHPLNGVPSAVLLTPVNATAVASAVNNLTSTTFDVEIAAAINWNAFLIIT